jgi:adenosylcobinamide-GDP ribazoletransferase
MNHFLGLIQFLTRIPIKKNYDLGNDFYKSAIYFPLVGALLGTFYFFISLLADMIFNSYIASLIVLLSFVFLTGGLHLDGLGDTFDALFSNRDKDKMLQIMKDSRLGTNALLAIVMILLFKLAFIFEIITLKQNWVLILVPACARYAQITACYNTKSPRENGMGNLFVGKISGNRFFATTLIACMIVSTINFMASKSFPVYLILIPITYLFTRRIVKFVYKKIDGITGDILGCVCELSEVLCLLLVYLLIKYV